MSSEDKKHRSHLPIPSPERTGLITYDAKDPDTKFPPIEQLRPPKGAPNVLIILIDDAGFGSSSAFGGPCQTPNAEKLAAGGLKYNRFHTTALCSPTRAALLTGRNHHSAGMGGITEIATGAPGYSSVLPNTISPLARTLKLNGYSTAQFGKCHEVPVWETSPVGPFDAWPTGGGGFEYFYGFIGGEANQWYPDAVRGHHAGRAEEDAGRGLPLHGGHDRQGDGLGVAAEGAGARQAVLRLLRARRDPRASPCAQGVGRQVQGQVRPGLGQAARRDHRPAEEAGRHPGGLPAHRAPRGDSGVGRHAGGAKAHPAPPDGGLCGVPGVHRPPCRTPARRLEEAQHPRRHARLLHHRRQRRLGRGHVERRVQRDGQLQRPGGPRDAGIPDGAVRQARRARSRTTTTPWAGRMQ